MSAKERGAIGNEGRRESPVRNVLLSSRRRLFLKGLRGSALALTLRAECAEGYEDGEGKVIRGLGVAWCVEARDRPKGW